MKITIITVCKNNRIGLEATLDSIFRQSCDNYELVIIDGGSDDGTIELKLEPGSYTVQLRYLWTNAFKIGMLLSCLSLLTLIVFWVKAPST